MNSRSDALGRAAGNSCTRRQPRSPEPNRDRQGAAICRLTSIPRRVGHPAAAPFSAFERPRALTFDNIVLQLKLVYLSPKGNRLPRSRPSHSCKTEDGMTFSDSAETRQSAGPHPRTVRYCDRCLDYKPHDLRPDGVRCLGCAAIVLTRELNRD